MKDGPTSHSEECHKASEIVLAFILLKINHKIIIIAAFPI